MKSIYKTIKSLIFIFAHPRSMKINFKNTKKIDIRKEQIELIPYKQILIDAGIIHVEITPYAEIYVCFDYNIAARMVLEHAALKKEVAKLYDVNYSDILTEDDFIEIYKYYDKRL